MVMDIYCTMNLSANFTGNKAQQGGAIPRVHNKNSEGECLTRTLSAKITAYVRGYPTLLLMIEIC